jgi:hypothetical protein
VVANIRYGEISYESFNAYRFDILEELRVEWEDSTNSITLEEQLLTEAGNGFSNKGESLLFL